jgi:hypothetical protein
MNIITVIVDKLPESALACKYASHEWEPVRGEVLVTCDLTGERGSMDRLSFITRRCFVCPLAEEAEEEVQE